VEIVGEARPARRAAEGAIKTPPGAGSLRRGSGFEGGVQSIEPLAPCGGANQEARYKLACRSKSKARAMVSRTGPVEVGCLFYVFVAALRRLRRVWTASPIGVSPFTSSNDFTTLRIISRTGP